MPNPLSGLGAKLPIFVEKVAGPPKLHQAAARGDLSEVRLLAQQQYNLDQQDKVSWGLLSELLRGTALGKGLAWACCKTLKARAGKLAVGGLCSSKVQTLAV